MKLSATIAIASISSCAAAFTGVPIPVGGAGRAEALNALSEDTSDGDGIMASRREAIGSFFTCAAAIEFLATPQQAIAFPNKISNAYDDRPKQRGGKPKDLGVAMRKDMISGGEDYLGLKPCAAGKPNCFCSTDPVDEYLSEDAPLPPFKWPKEIAKEEAFQQLYETIQAYEPGQNNIDGGGFDIVKYDPKAGYIYVQFESVKNGYTDDFELAVVGNKSDNEVQVRSSSRLGFVSFDIICIIYG